MTNFPVTNSMLSAKHIVLFLQQKYGLTEKTTCRILKAGINDTYLVSDGTVKYVFRVYSLGWRTQAEIQAELALLHDLHQNDIAVSYPVADSENVFIQTLNAPEGQRFAVLFTYADGEKLHHITAETHFLVGQLMARLHKVNYGKKIDRVSYTPQILLIDALAQISPFLNGKCEEMTFMRSAQAYLLHEFANADLSLMRQGAVHLDIWFDNINVTPSQKVTIFDFDFCGNGSLALDIAYYVMQLHNIERYEADSYQPKVDSFIQGYETITPISAEEKRLLPMLGVSLYFFYLGVQCQRYDNWSNSFLNENYLKRFINGLVKRYYDIYELGKE
jgi:Ser/Thr protein kinase RdoA (MazF antagonist)